MDILNTAYTKIELVDGVFYQKLSNGIKNPIFLYKFKRIENCCSIDDVFNVSFKYDLVILDQQCQNYLYFTYVYLDEPQEVF